MFKSFFAEFRKFATKGNVIDLAVAFMLTTAFNRITQSLVNDIIMPPIGLLLGRVDFASLYINLSGQEFATFADAKAAGAATINYGAFINTVLNFVVVALLLFFVVRQMNRVKPKPEAAPAAPTTKECPFCYTTISIKAVRCPNCTSSLEGV